MKEVLMLLALGIGISAAFGQKIKESEVPAAVKIAFQTQYPKVTSVQWDKEKDAYEASFDLNQVDQSVLFDDKGKIIETEVEIKMDQLPKGVADYVKTHYKGMAIKETAKITDQNGVVTYEAAVKGKDLMFDSNGKFLKEIKD